MMDHDHLNYFFGEIERHGGIDEFVAARRAAFAAANAANLTYEMDALIAEAAEFGRIGRELLAHFQYQNRSQEPKDN